MMNKKLIFLLLLCLMPAALLAGSGDANGDGKVNVADMVEILNYLKGAPSDHFNTTAADVSGNGKVDETDVKILREAIMAGDKDLASAIEYYALQEMIRQAQEKIDELNEQVNQKEPKLLLMEFLASENPMQLVEDATCEIVGDSAVECRVLNVMSAKTLIPRFQFTGDYVTIGGQEAESGKTAFDFSSEQTLVVHCGEKTKAYKVTVSAYTGLPTLWAETKNRKLKESGQYYDATVSITGNAGYGDSGSLAKTTGRMMAQGPLRYYTKISDWSGDEEWGKNDYKLNFNNAVSLLDMPAHTDWLLMPNVNDITMLHNQTAFFMGKMSALANRTPQFHYVDLMFNGRYTGTYLLGECPETVGTDNTDILVDWYLINEIAKNEKGTSEMVWDFETAFGDAGKTGATGFVAKNTDRYQRLFQDMDFVAKVKERFDYFYRHQADIIRDINENAQYLKYAIQEDDTKWDTFESYKSSNADTWVLYQGHVSSMKSWLSERMAWLKEQFDAMQGSRTMERVRWDAAQTLRNAEQGIQNDYQPYTPDRSQRNAQLRLMWEELQQRIESLERLLEERQEPKLLSMEFVTNDNQSLRESTKCKIVGDSIIECWLSGTDNGKVLKPRFTYEGTMVVIDGFEAESGKTEIDFTKPRTVTVATSGKNKYYTIYVHSKTGLPMMYITTDGLQEVTSKDTYIGANLVLKEDVKTRAAGDVIESRVNIKGRGNSSWKFAKKPFTLKFDEKMSLVDMHKDKTWVLTPNYNDKSMLRNSLAFYMSSISNIDYTPESHFVELVFNGQYWGTYLLCEKLKIAKHRVNEGDDGFLVEVDFRATSEYDSRHFHVTHLENVVNVKDPDVQYGDENYLYVKEYINKADDVLFSSLFTDPNVGWQAYLDMDSFVDWYLIQEIGKNLDGNFASSCYMHLARGGKLKMGPIWDMDVAYGNIDEANQTCYLTTDFYIKDTQWYSRLFQDPVFVARVKERFNYFYSHMNDILANVNADAQYLKYSAQENDQVWHLLNVMTWPNYNIWGSYQNEVQDVKEWLTARMEWLKTQFDKM
jgi:hypothetical protein